MKTPAFVFLTFLTALSLFSAQSLAIQFRLPLEAEAKRNPAYVNLKSIIDGLKKKSVESFLEALKAKYPGHFKEYAMVFDSRSLHQATMDDLRIVLNGHKYQTAAQFVLAFGNVPTDPRYHTVELMIPNRADKDNHTYEIAFDPNGINPPKIDIQPQVCNKCHGYPAKGTYDEYFFWPGTIGSEDDQFTFTADSNLPKTPENTGFDNLVDRIAREKRAGTGRFRFLEPPDHPQRPNLTLNDGIRDFNLANLANRIANDPKLKPVRHMLLSIAINTNRNCDDDFKSFYSPAGYEMVKGTLDSLEKEIQAADDFSLRARHDRNKSLVGVEAVARAAGYDRSSDYYVRTFAHFRLLLEGYGKWDVNQFAIEANQKSSGSHVLVYLGDYLKKEALASGEKTEGLDYFTSCNSLKKLHDKEWEKQPDAWNQLLAEAKSEFSKWNDPNSIFSRCVGCHQASGTAPYLPFHRPNVLKKMIVASSRLKAKVLELIEAPNESRMPPPPERPLSPKEREAIRRFVNR